MIILEASNTFHHISLSGAPDEVNQIAPHISTPPYWVGLHRPNLVPMGFMRSLLSSHLAQHTRTRVQRRAPTGVYNIETYRVPAVPIYSMYSGCSTSSSRHVAALVALILISSTSLVFHSLIAAATGDYPQDALKCLASLKEPDEELICPEHRFVSLHRSDRRGY